MTPPTMNAGKLKLTHAVRSLDLPSRLSYRFSRALDHGLRNRAAGVDTMHRTRSSDVRPRRRTAAGRVCIRDRGRGGACARRPSPEQHRESTEGTSRAVDCARAGAPEAARRRRLKLARHRR